MVVSSQEKEQEVVALPTGSSRRHGTTVKRSISLGQRVTTEVPPAGSNRTTTDNTLFCVVHKVSVATFAISFWLFDMVLVICITIA